MIKHLKFSMKMIRYGYGLLLNCLAGIISGAMGLLYIILSFYFEKPSVTLYFGCILISMTGYYPIQIWMSFNSTGLVLSSPRGRASLCTIPTLMLSVSSVIGFSFSLLLCLFLNRFYPMEQTAFCGTVYMIALCICFLMIFFTISYRYFFIYVISFLTVFPVLMIVSADVLFHLQQRCAGSVFFTLPVTVLVCCGILSAGVLLASRIALSLRRKPISKWAQGAALRKYL